LDSKGKDQNNGVMPLANKYATAEGCLKACMKSWSSSGVFHMEATGCEHYAREKSCYVHTREVVSGGGKDGYACFLLKKNGMNIFVVV
jgi:hypothetical protein